jgi:hypothetical protein
MRIICNFVVLDIIRAVYDTYVKRFDVYTINRRKYKANVALVHQNSSYVTDLYLPARAGGHARADARAGV